MPENIEFTKDGSKVTDLEAIEILKSLIAIPTVDPPGNEMEAAVAVQKILKEENIDSQIYDLGNGRANLVARLKGSGDRPALVFSAHFDTIPVDESQWTMPPFGGEIRDGKMYGRGATDMKSGLASMVCAAIELKRKGIKLSGDLILAFSAAENSSGMGAIELTRCGELNSAGAMVISEPTSLKVFIAEKGALWLKAKAKGASGHAAFVADWRSDYGNAIVRMAKFIAQLEKLDLNFPHHPHLDYPTVNVGKISGGISAPIIPNSCTMDLDIRMVPGMEPDFILKKIQDLAGKYIEIEIIDYKPPVETEVEDPFVHMCIEACESVVGMKADVTGVPYYSDATVFAPALQIPIVIIGPGEVGHSGIADEYVKISSMIKTNQIFSLIARKYLTLDHF